MILLQHFIFATNNENTTRLHFKALMEPIVALIEVCSEVI